MHVRMGSRAIGARRREALAPGLAPAAVTGDAGTGRRASVHLCGEGPTARFGCVLRDTRQQGRGDAGRARWGGTRISSGRRHAPTVKRASSHQRLGPRRARHVKHAGLGHTQRRRDKHRRSRVRNAEWARTGRQRGAARVLNVSRANTRQHSAQLRAWYARIAALGSTRPAWDRRRRRRAWIVRRGSMGRAQGAVYVRNVQRARLPPQWRRHRCQYARTAGRANIRDH